jgi:4-alpha-glucanotransferase
MATDIPRSSGILLHPTSLPSPYGIGDLGSSAHDFVDALAASGQTWWQMLPLNVPGHGGSPYSAESAFAGNPALIDLDALAEKGWLEASSLKSLADACAKHAPSRINFSLAIPAKMALLDAAWETASKDKGVRAMIEAFETSEAAWLEDYVLFAALKEKHPNKSWRDWPRELVARSASALEREREECADAIARHTFYQWVFFSQWSELRDHARAKGIRLIGDIPIFVAMDSADVWANRHLFKLDERGHAEVVAGVPPDYFSATGQKWGNPVYDWSAVEENNYAWWISRVKKAIETVDLVRIDHFRGFQDYWETPSNKPTAIDGEWVAGPRDAFFEAIKGALGEVPFIAEDLGLIDEPVYELRDRFHLPGMKVMHFAFGGEPDHPFLPHTYPEHCVAYTGTHDNDTTRGWYENTSDEERHRARIYLSSPDEEIVDAMIEALFGSRANLTILPAQDLWELGTEHRMNTPSTIDGNWSWRMTAEQLSDEGAWSVLGDRTKRHARTRRKA